jgi:predicted DNA-binding protein with PD1-like motif
VLVNTNVLLIKKILEVFSLKYVFNNFNERRGFLCMGDLYFIEKESVKYLVQCRVKEDKDLLKALYEITEKEDIKSGIIISGLGALTQAICRNVKEFPEKYPVKNENRLYFKLEKPLELLSLSGWIARREDDSPEVHAHFAASTVEDDKIITVGGHLSEGTITGIKVVVAILVLNGDHFQAAFDNISMSHDLTTK